MSTATCFSVSKIVLRDLLVLDRHGKLYVHLHACLYFLSVIYHLLGVVKV